MVYSRDKLQADDGNLTINNDVIYNQGKDSQVVQSKNIPDLFLESSLQKEMNIKLQEEKKLLEVHQGLFLKGDQVTSFQSQDKLTQRLFQVGYELDEVALSGENHEDNELSKWSGYVFIGFILIGITYLGIVLGRKYSTLLRFKKEG